MTEKAQIILPIKGMTCANCVSTIERNVKKLDGIEDVAVNLSSERAAIGFNKSEVQIDDIVEKIKHAGYDIAAARGEFTLKISPDSSDAERIRRVLSTVEGVLSVNVNLSSDKIFVDYIPTILSQIEIRKFLKKSSAKERNSESETFVGHWDDIHNTSLFTFYE